jgi:RNA polymerase sigma-70 factor, ECF subfamily
MVDIKKKSDAQVVKLCLKDDEAFEVLVERYEKKLLRYVMRISSFDFATAEDVMQDVFVNVYRNLNGYDDEFSFSSWIYRIAHNVTVSYVRKMKVRPQVVDMGDDNEYVDLLPDGMNIAKEMDRKALQKKVREALMELPVKYRDVLVLRFLEDKSYSEISDILKRSVNSVSVLINRGKAKLKDKLINK